MRDGIDIVTGAEEIHGRPMGRDFRTDALDVAGCVGRIPGPWEATLRQDGNDAAVARKVRSLVQELRAVSIGRFGVEPVEEEHRWPASALFGLDQEGLGVIRDANVVDAGAGPNVRCHAHRSSAGMRNVPKEQASDLGDRSHRCRQDLWPKPPNPLPELMIEIL